MDEREKLDGDRMAERGEEAVGAAAVSPPQKKVAQNNNTTSALHLLWVATGEPSGLPERTELVKPEKVLVV